MIVGRRDRRLATFADRSDAGRRLARRLGHLRDEDAVVVALPRGGVPVAYEVASALAAPLDVIVVRKLGAPTRPELGIGAIGEHGVVLVNRAAVAALSITDDELEAIVERELDELERRLRRYRGDRPPVPVDGRTAILVDDGVATGGTARAGARIVRKRGAARIVLAVPVGPPGLHERIGDDVDELVQIEAPPDFFAGGQVYASFDQVGDDEVRALLAGAPDSPGGRPPESRRLGGLAWTSGAWRD